VWAVWFLLDWCDDHIYLWAGYLNSKAPASWRGRFLTYDHLQHWMTLLEWFFRWVVVPAKILPYAMASAQWGWRIPWRRVLGILWNWRWWPAVFLLALLGETLPTYFFAADPHGAVPAQIWRVGIKISGAYLLGVATWVLQLGWLAVLFARQELKPPAEEAMVRAPVASGPPLRELGAKAEPPAADESSAQ
jgi:hypothetical protein